MIDHKKREPLNKKGSRPTSSRLDSDNPGLNLVYTYLYTTVF